MKLARALRIAVAAAVGGVDLEAAAAAEVEAAAAAEVEAAAAAEVGAAIEEAGVDGEVGK
jgi:hypothetical protein